MEALGLEMRRQATLRALTEDVVKTSEIKGEILATDQVRSSIANRLGLDIGGLPAPDTADEMTVGSELAARKERLEFLDDRIELGEQFADPRPSVACLATASHCHVFNSG